MKEAPVKPSLALYEPEVRLLERRCTRTPPPHAPVAFYGSSSIRLWKRLPRDFPAVPLVNLGFGGSTLEACAWYFERLVVPCRPRALIVYAGDNDLGEGQTPDDVLHSFRSLLHKVEHFLGNLPLGFISIKPSPARWPIDRQIRQSNAMIQRELDRREASTYIDVYAPMLGDDGTPQRHLYALDGLHLSAAGYRLWAEIVWAYGKHAFGESSSLERLSRKPRKL